MEPRRVFHQVSYNRDIVSRYITNDLSRILLQNHPDEIIQNEKSIIHFVNNRFHFSNSNEEASMKIKFNNCIASYSPISTRPPTPIKIILQQINTNKIGFEYLSYVDLKTF